MTHRPALPPTFATIALALACAAPPAAAAAKAQGPDALAGLVNAYRAAPRECQGRMSKPLPPLTPQRALSNVQIGPGAFLDQVLEQRGYPVAKADAITITGPTDAAEVMAAIKKPYCKTLLNPQFGAIGAGRSGDSWLLLLAEPAPPPAATLLPDSATAGKAILQEVNAARTTARHCGAQRFAAAPQLTWNGLLGNAALAHSRDMAEHRYFSHKGKDGSDAAARAAHAGYQWRRVGENIASGQSSPQEVVDGWLSSPGHCANIMNGGFTEMGAGYAASSVRLDSRVYWTQVFGTPR